MEEIREPLKRSKLRMKVGRIYYDLLRKYVWIRMHNSFSRTYYEEKLAYSYFSHKTVLMRKLKDVDMWLQENKVNNLKIAVNKVNTIIVRPGEVFSYWKLIGKPTKYKGYLPGMVLQSGTVTAGTGGGLCQLSNLIFWMTIHTPLTVVERHRHGYDVFPDSNRTQPFGSGATCFYPHGDLMIKNNTQDTYQFIITVGDKYLEGEWRVSSEPQYSYNIVERNHEIKSEFWGGYSRHNELYQQKYNLAGVLIDEKLVVSNSAIMMYSPLLSDEKHNLEYQ